MSLCRVGETWSSDVKNLERRTNLFYTQKSKSKFTNTISQPIESEPNYAIYGRFSVP